MSREATDLIIINGIAIPAPDEGFTIDNYTLVDAGRNSNGVQVGHVIGPEDGVWKINNLQWTSLTPEEWKLLRTLLLPFYVRVTFTNDLNERITCTMYPGDRSAMPYHVERLSYKMFRNCKFNLIDTGKR